MSWGFYTALAVGTLIFASNALAEQYLCIADQSTGFKLSGAEWKSVDFSVDRKKVLVIAHAQPNSAGPNKRRFTVKGFGNEGISHTCERFEDGETISNRILCGGLGIGFVMDTKTLRYQELYGIGYLEGDEPGNTPSLTIGRCTRAD